MARARADSEWSDEENSDKRWDDKYSIYQYKVVHDYDGVVDLLSGYTAEPAVLPSHPVSGTITNSSHYRCCVLLQLYRNRTPSLIRTALLLSRSYQPLVREDEEEEYLRLGTNTPPPPPPPPTHTHTEWLTLIFYTCSTCAGSKEPGECVWSENTATLQSS